MNSAVWLSLHMPLCVIVLLSVRMFFADAPWFAQEHIHYEILKRRVIVNLTKLALTWHKQPTRKFTISSFIMKYMWTQLLRIRKTHKCIGNISGKDLQGSFTAQQSKGGWHFRYPACNLHLHKPLLLTSIKHADHMTSISPRCCTDSVSMNMIMMNPAL